MESKPDRMVGKVPPSELRHYLPWGGVTPAGEQLLRRAAAKWIEANGWPTGCRYVRGTHSSSYVFDVLGTDRPPMNYRWPYERPSFEDIVQALVT